MSEYSNIAWTHSTFNPWRICTPVGPGCEGCYAAAMGRRFGLEYKQGVPRIRTSAANWKKPLVWNKKAAASGEVWRVFCASLADLFDNEAPQAWREDLWELICDTPHLEWLLVTKRIGNVEKMGGAMLLKTSPNTRLIITVCNQQEADRDIPKLLALPCKNGISYEPALGPVDWRPWCVPNSLVTSRSDLRTLQWVIVGGESGPKARPFDLALARRTISQCKSAGIPVFFKQAGAKPFTRCQSCGKDVGNILGGLVDACGPTHAVLIGELSRIMRARAGADPSEWPEDLRVREFPQ